MDDLGMPVYEKEWFGPLVGSILLHLFLIVAALFIHFQTAQDKAKDQNLLEFHLNKVERGSTLSGKTGGGGSGFPKKFKAVNPVKAPPVDRQLDIEAAESDLPMENDLKPVPSSSKNLDALIFENEKEDATRQLKVRQESLNDFYQKNAEKSVKAVAPGGEGLLRSLAAPLQKIQPYSPGNMAVDPEEGMPGFTPSQGAGDRGVGGAGGGDGRGIGDGVGNGPGGPGLSSGNDEGGNGISAYEPLDNFLDVQVYTYEDASDGQKYFMLKIYAKPGSQALEVMPKEILFTIDCSLSISRDRLEEFKRGIRYCLLHLNKGDVFNLIAFKDEVLFFSGQSVTADSDSIKRAEKFVSDLTASQSTDVYAAFTKIIEKSMARTPSNIILMSDGLPTNGIVDSRELINSVTRLNHNARPVFAFTGGAKVNRYLLDFLAVVRSETVMIDLKDEQSPAVVRPGSDDGIGCKYVVMPMRLPASRVA